MACPFARHKITDVNGYYPDYNAGPVCKQMYVAPMKIRRVPMDKTGANVTYGFDGLLVTQWEFEYIMGIGPAGGSGMISSACLITPRTMGSCLALVEPVQGDIHSL